MNSNLIRAACVITATMVAGACQTTPETASAPSAQANATATAAVDGETAAVATTASATPGMCVPGQLTLAGGPPPKPDRTGDFFAGAAENVGRNVTRNVGTNVAQNIFARAIPGIGGAVAVAATPAVAQQVVQKAEDLWDDWKSTDGQAGCGCTVTFYKSALRADLVKSSGCASADLQQVARWKLGHSFTGYDAKLELFSEDRRVVATLNREGLDYFQGALADGTPVTLWRE